MFVNFLCDYSGTLLIVDEGHFDFQSGRNGRTVSLKRESYILHDLGYVALMSTFCKRSVVFFGERYLPGETVIYKILWLRI